MGKGIRLISIYIDLLVISVVYILLFFMTNYGTWITLMYFTAWFVSLLCKDAFKISVSRRIFKMKIYKVGTCKEASFRQKILRNITLPIWPIDAIYMLASKDGRRLGDKIAKTEVRFAQKTS